MLSTKSHLSKSFIQAMTDDGLRCLFYNAWQALPHVKILSRDYASVHGSVHGTYISSQHSFSVCICGVYWKIHEAICPTVANSLHRDGVKSLVLVTVSPWVTHFAIKLGSDYRFIKIE